MAKRITYIPNRVIDQNGISDGATIDVFQTGTTTRVTIYSDEALTTPLANPLTVNAGAAVPPIYHNEAGNVRVRVSQSGGTVISDDDPWNLANADGVVTNTGGTVQSALTALQATDASLLDLTATLSVTSATALAITDLNKLVIASGSTNYTINLPAATLAGSALKLEVARSTTGVVTVQAAAGSGKLVNGLSIIDMIAGESALAVYDGTNWRFMDWVRVPFLAEMLNTAASAQSLTTGSFNDVPLATVGRQLMQSDLSALWSASGGYFTAPRAGVYAIDLHFWAEHSSGPGQYDVGAYAASTGGGTPGNRDFARVSVGTESFRTLMFRTTMDVAKGFKIYPCVRPNSPLTSASIVAGATLQSRVTITELFRA